MRALSEVMYTEEGRRYQMVELNEWEKEHAFYLKDVPPDRLDEIIILPYHPLPFPSEPESESE
jgi:hypothetical protein